jgi:hypothetical protein
MNLKTIKIKSKKKTKMINMIGKKINPDKILVDHLLAKTKNRKKMQKNKMTLIQKRKMKIMAK